MKQESTRKMTDLSGTGPTNQAQRALNLALLTDRLTAVSDISIITKFRRRLESFRTQQSANTEVSTLSAGQVRRLIAEEKGCGCRYHHGTCASCDHILRDVYPM